MNRFGRTAVLLLASFALIAGRLRRERRQRGDSSAPAAAGTDAAAATTDAAAASTEAAPAGDVSDADVAAGLAQMVTVATDISREQAAEAEAGKTAAEGLEPHWAPIEDRVKANDPDAYIAIRRTRWRSSRAATRPRPPPAPPRSRRPSPPTPRRSQG